jgi:hypothetical protein
MRGLAGPTNATRTQTLSANTMTWVSTSAELEVSRTIDKPRSQHPYSLLKVTTIFYVA